MAIVASVGVVGLVRQLGLNLQFVLNTHVHADHITGTGDSMKEIKKTIPYCPPIKKVQYDMHRAFETTHAEHKVSNLEGQWGKGRRSGLRG